MVKIPSAIRWMERKQKYEMKMFSVPSVLITSNNVRTQKRKKKKLVGQTKQILDFFFFDIYLASFRLFQAELKFPYSCSANVTCCFFVIAVGLTNIKFSDVICNIFLACSF